MATCYFNQISRIVVWHGNMLLYSIIEDSCVAWQHVTLINIEDSCVAWQHVTLIKYRG